MGPERDAERRCALRESVEIGRQDVTFEQQRGGGERGESKRHSATEDVRQKWRNGESGLRCAVIPRT